MDLARRMAACTMLVAVAWLGAAQPAAACTNFLITKGASADGSVMITYAADSHEYYGELSYSPPGVHSPGTMREVIEWDTGKYLGQIDQAAETYSVVGNMNEYQVAIGETTFTGRPELQDPKSTIDYGSLMYMGLQRSKTAREAIQVMTGLVANYGYYSNTTRSMSVNGFPFTDGCAPTTSVDTLAPGTSVRVSTPDFTYDLAGAEITVSITICTDENMLGTCVSKKLAYTP